jgi:putative DNA-invertase from lambdoid prophage Rac
LLAQLHLGDTLVVTELSRLGRSTGEVLNFIDGLLAAGIRVVVLKQNLNLDKTSDDVQAITG